jgi:hypothetical protein
VLRLVDDLGEHPAIRVDLLERAARRRRVGDRAQPLLQPVAEPRHDVVAHRERRPLDGVDLAEDRARSLLVAGGGERGVDLREAITDRREVLGAVRALVEAGAQVGRRQRPRARGERAALGQQRAEPPEQLPEIGLRAGVARDQAALDPPEGLGRLARPHEPERSLHRVGDRARVGDGRLVGERLRVAVELLPHQLGELVVHQGEGPGPAPSFASLTIPDSTFRTGASTGESAAEACVAPEASSADSAVSRPFA